MPRASADTVGLRSRVVTVRLRPDQFSGSVRSENGVMVITLGGILHQETRTRFAALIDGAVASRAPLVVVDMAHVAVVDSASLDALVAAARRLRSSGSTIELRAVSACVYMRLEIAGHAQELNVERPDPVLISELSSAAEAPHTRAVLDAALQLVVVMAQSVVAGADGVSITLPRNGRLGTVAASNDVVLDMDHDQYDTGQGPCLDAATEGVRFHIDALSDEARWPAFVPRARARGIETILSAPLLSDDHPLGALNLYSRTARAFAVHEKRWAEQFAQEASHVVSSALPEVGPDVLSRQVQEALDSRDVIAQAQGVVIHRDGLSPEAAYAVLRDLSSSTGQPLRDVSARLIASSGATPSPRRPADGSTDGPLGP